MAAATAAPMPREAPVTSTERGRRTAGSVATRAPRAPEGAEPLTGAVVELVMRAGYVAHASPGPVRPCARVSG